jgi:hypothetical protein
VASQCSSTWVKDVQHCTAANSLLESMGGERCERHLGQLHAVHGASKYAESSTSNCDFDFHMLSSAFLV